MKQTLRAPDLKQLKGVVDTHPRQHSRLNTVFSSAEQPASADPSTNNEAESGNTVVQLRAKLQLKSAAAQQSAVPRRMSSHLEPNAVRASPIHTRSSPSPALSPGRVVTDTRSQLASRSHTSIGSDKEKEPSNRTASTQSSLKSRALLNQSKVKAAERDSGGSLLSTPASSRVSPNTRSMIDDSELPLSAAERAAPGTELPVKASEEFRKRLSIIQQNEATSSAAVTPVQATPVPDAVPDIVVIDEPDQRISDLKQKGANISNWETWARPRSKMSQALSTSRHSPPPGFLE